MSKYTRIDYLVVGHISQDLTDDGTYPGGTALYSALAAHTLGCRVAVLTSVAMDFDISALLPGITVKVVPADNTTTFRNDYSSGQREQSIYGTAQSLEASDVPFEWQRAAIVHLGPIAGEIDPKMIRLFSNSVIGLTPQGWYRKWNEDGRIFAGEWPGADEYLPLAAAVILSPEDLPSIAVVDEIKKSASIVVLTQQEGGCIVHFQDSSRLIPAPRVEEVNPTGAGDIFATAFLVRLHQTRGNPWEAAEFANLVASSTVAKNTLSGKINSIRDVIIQES